MKSVFINKCKNGEIIAEDIFNNGGVILVTKNTPINDYIKLKLIDYGVLEIKIYDSVKDRKAHMKFERQYKEYIEQMRELIRDISLGVYEDIDDVTSYLTKQIFSNSGNNELIVNCLITLRNNDEYTYTHSINTAFYSMLIGNCLSLTRNQMCDLISSGLLHDIGKTKIPPEILNKNGKLEEDEYEIIKNHPIYGYEIIEKLPGLKTEVKRAVLLHHERMDGTGYPYGLKANDICLYARIIAIADVFDAMTQNRVYKRKVTPFRSFEMFLTEGIRIFDYPILRQFLKYMAPLYVGSRAQLNNGDVGEIVFIPPYDITSPILSINSEYVDLSRSGDLKVIDII